MIPPDNYIHTYTIQYNKLISSFNFTTINEEKAEQENSQEK